jgi:hypothetical protein
MINTWLHHKKFTKKNFESNSEEVFIFYFFEKTASCQQIVHKFPHIYLKLLQQEEIFYDISEPHVQHTPTWASQSVCSS